MKKGTKKDLTKLTNMELETLVEENYEVEEYPSMAVNRWESGESYKIEVTGKVDPWDVSTLSVSPEKATAEALLNDLASKNIVSVGEYEIVVK